MNPRDDEHTPHGYDEQANVVYLPTDRDDAPTVVDAEVIDGDDERAPARTDQTRQAYNTRLIPTAARERMATGAVVAVRRATPVAATSGKAALRHSLYPFYGVRAVARRYRDNRGSARFERQMRIAETKGDQEALRYWQEAKSAETDRKHARHMDWMDSPMKLLKAVGAGLAGLGALLLLAGIALAIGGQDMALVIAPIASVMEAIQWAWWFGTAYGALLLLAGTAGGVLYLWNEGRKEEGIPDWVQPTDTADHEGAREVVNVTPSIVVAALRDAKIAPLRKAIKADPDNGAWMLGPITRRGHGVEVTVTLPSECTVGDVMGARKVLAGNLDRKAHEILIEASTDSEAKFTLWIANSGALDYPVPPSPLMDEDYGPVDVYRDTMPWGVTAQGDPIELNLHQQHVLIAGLSKQGKTASARSLALWAALDPSAKFWIADLKGFGDWSMFADLAEQLIEGAGDENFIATCDMLEAAVAEMEDRYARWRALGKKGDIDRAHSQPGSGFEPLFIVIDEVQKLYTCITEHPDGGDIGGSGKKARAARAAQALHDQARAVNIHLWQFAQNPTDKNLPVVVREGAMIRGSLFVGTESIAKMALGEAPVDTGAAPHALRQGFDRGTVVLAPGESMDLPGGASHTTVRTHYIGTKDAYAVIEQAKQHRTNHTPPEDDERDLLADVAHVLGGEDRVKAADVAARLRDLAPGYTPYVRLDGTALKSHLSEYGVEVKYHNGTPKVNAERVRATLAYRDGYNPDTNEPAP